MGILDWIFGKKSKEDPNAKYCTVCGIRVSDRNISGRCWDCAMDLEYEIYRTRRAIWKVRGRVKHCVVCGISIRLRNVSGRCQKHYLERVRRNASKSPKNAI